MRLYGWRFIFVPAIIIVPIAVGFTWLLPESEKFRAGQSTGVAPPFSQSLATLLSPHLRRRTIAAFVLFVLYGGAYAGTAFYFPTYFQEYLGYSEAEAARIVGLSYGIGLIGYLAAALTGEHLLTRRNTIAIWLLTGAAAFIGLLWVAGDRMEQVIWFGLVAAFFYGVPPSNGRSRRSCSRPRRGPPAPRSCSPE